MSASTVDWAVKYIQRFGFKLVSIPRGCKGPIDDGWNSPGRWIEDVEKAKVHWGNGSDEGVGVVLGPSGVCSIDIDFVEHAERALGALGIDLPALRQGVPTIVGNPERYRVVFAVPPGAILSRKVLAWPPKKAGEKPHTIFELRGGNVQDCLPPTRHPDFRTPYVWADPPDGGFPPLPEVLLELWLNWDSYKLELEGLCPWANGGFKPKASPRGPGPKLNVIAAYNAAHSVEELLERHEYTRKGGRWLSPSSSTGLAGAVILDDGRVYSHHGSDPLSDGHSHDAFDVFRILDHGKDGKAATKAAAEELGIGSNASGKAGSTGEVVYRRMSDIKSKPIHWLWPERVARGKIFLVAGHPGLGKSQVTCSMTSVTTTGGSWPVDRTQCERGSVIILSAEDDAEDTIRPRLEAAGADLARIYILDAVRVPGEDGATRLFDLTADITRLGDLVDKLGDVALVVIDPVTAYMGDVDSHKNAEVRRVLAPLAAMAAEKGIAVVCVTHLSKAGGPEVLLRVMGSLAFVATARGTYLVANDPGDEARRLFLPMKSNISEDRGGLAYRVKGRDLGGGIKVSVVEWDAEPVNMTADEAMAPVAAPEEPEERGAMDESVRWLSELLENGPVDSTDIASDAKKAGISWTTVKRAKARLGVRAVKAAYSRGWRWELPESARARAKAQRGVGPLGKPTPLKPSPGAGSTEGDQGSDGSRSSTPLKPSPGAGSTEGDQGSEKSEDLGPLRSNVGVVRVTGDCGAQEDQAGPLLRDVEITIGSHRPFPAYDPAGRTLEVWKAKVLAAHGPDATVRPAPVNGGV